MLKKPTWRHLTAILLFIILIWAVFGKVADFGFANIDDSVYVTQNAHVLSGLSWNNVRWAFTSTHAGFWHPLTWLSLMLDGQNYGADAHGYHLTNLWLHIASSLLLLAFLFKSTGVFWRSGFVAALFALHPLHVESVAWIGERKDVLSAFFWMLTIYAYVYYTERPDIKRYLLVVLFFFMGLMSKPMLVTMPFVLFLLDLWPLRRISFLQKSGSSDDLAEKVCVSSKTVSLRSLILEKIPLLIIAAPISIVTFYAEKNFGALPTIAAFPMAERIGNAFISYVRYMGKAILPINLSVYYPHPGMWPLWQVFISFVLVALLCLIFLRNIKRYPYLATGWFWYLGTLIPVIGLIQVGPFAMADRYTYIPLIGLFIMSAWGVPELLRQFPHKKLLLRAGAIMLIGVLSVISWQRCQLWGDNYALWDDVLKKYNISVAAGVKENSYIAFAYNFRGLGQAEKGNYRKAIEDYNYALKINDKYTEAYNNRSCAYAMIGRNDLASDDLERTLKLNPNYADGYYNRGLLNLNLTNLDKAISDFSEAIRIDPYMVDALNYRGVAFRENKQYEKSIYDFEQAIKINKKFSLAYKNRASVYYILNKYDAAIEDLTKAIDMNPGDMDAYFKRAIAFTGAGRHHAAVMDYRLILTQQTFHIPSLNNLGMLLKDMKRYEEAAIQFRKLLQIKPDDKEALKYLNEIENLKKSI